MDYWLSGRRLYDEIVIRRDVGVDLAKPHDPVVVEAIFKVHQMKVSSGGWRLPEHTREKELVAPQIPGDFVLSHEQIVSMNLPKARTPPLNPCHHLLIRHLSPVFKMTEGRNEPEIRHGKFPQIRL